MNEVKYSLIPYDRRTHCLYVHVNKVNGKKYFGITKGYAKSRWGGGSGYYKSTKFYPAIKKYGWDGFYHIIILKNLSKDEALYLEKSYISLYQTTNRDFGYNTDKGGKDTEVSFLVKRRLMKERRVKPIICLETGERFESAYDIEALTSKNHSYVREACLSKGSRVHDGKHYLYIEDYIKLNLQEVQDIIDGKLQNHQEVVCMETGEVFWDATKAGNTLSYGKCSVSNRCNHFRERGKDNFAGGFHWAFKEDYDKLTPKEIEKVINLDNFKVVCLETKKIYENPIIASRNTGADEGCIRKCCQGILRHSKGLHWMYEKNYRNATKEDIEKIYNKPRKEIESCRIKNIVCVETGKIYRTMSDAAKDTGAHVGNISKSCKLGSGYKSGGYHWMFEEDYNKATFEEISGRLKRVKKLSKKAVSVYCIETGISYKTAKYAKEENYKSIVDCCRLNKKDFINNKKAHFTANGLHWFYLKDVELLKGYNKEDLFKVEVKLKTEKKIICLETEKVYESVNEIVMSLNCKPDTIKKACRRKDKYAFGCHWMYLEDYEKLNKPDVQVIMSQKRRSHPLFHSVVTKAVFNITRNKKYKSVFEASQDTGFNVNSIQDACCRRHILKNEIWFYTEDVNKIEEKEFKELIEEIKQKRDKRVVCLETKEVFENSKEACKKYSTSASCIISCCTNSDPNRLTAGGVHWMYYKDYLKATPKEIEAKLKTKQGQKVSKAVIKLETKEVFSSIEEASSKTGLSSKTIRYSCTGQWITTPKNGHWMFKSDYDKATPKEVEERLKISMKGKMHNMRKVKCIETGEVFKSIIEANEAIGGCKNSSMISKCCKNSQLSYKGYHWEYVS